MVETEREATESLFYFMKDKKYTVFLEPSQRIIDLYLPDKKDTWIVKPFITGSPTQNFNQVTTTCLEKLLVDLVSDTEILNAQQGAERERIIEEALSKYTINTNKLLRYAARRGKKSIVRNYLNEKQIFDNKPV